MKVVMVGGDFNYSGGRESHYIAQLFANVAYLIKQKWADSRIYVANGGDIDILHFVLRDCADADIVFWFANVPNDIEKVKGVKEINPHCLLITSKRNNNEYSFKEIVNKALLDHSNLFVVFSREPDCPIRASIYDPLGNCFAQDETNILNLSITLSNRVFYLTTLTRMGSVQVGEAIPVPDEKEFFGIVRKFGNIFTSLIDPAEGTTRFLGNSSFRCTKGGFPSFKHDGKIFVSQRNIDKSCIDKDGFVAVNIATPKKKVEYYGDKKPSVDTPVQLAIYILLPKIKYIIHSHVYIEGAPFTFETVPCGAFEEFDEIYSIINKNHFEGNFSINLKGHGSIILAEDLSYFDTIKYYSRPLPELY